ncbi:MAG: cyclic pyranopterin monophosphate synthase MoaC [Saprospiraceae bacterium]|nr:cyclic pyranopterin monophosphate synthase MoaC [Saprospiraceae bacterium]
MSDSFTHLDADGKPSMVDVGQKKVTHRIAKARAVMYLGKEVMEKLQGSDWNAPKGSVFQTAVIAGVMAAKKTGDLIPLCHPLGMDNCQVDIQIKDEDHLEIYCTASVNAKTGIEMEALTGASVAALTVYDMCKALSHHLIIKEIRLVEKTGGKKDFKLEE